MTNAEAGRRASAQFVNLVLCAAVVGAASMLYYHQGLLVPRASQSRAARNLGGGYAFGNDFYQIWLTSREWLEHRSNPYSEEMTREIQIGLYGRTLDPKLPGDPKDQRRFPYPAFTDLLFWPTALLPFPAVRVVGLFVLTLLTVSSVWAWITALRWKLDWRWNLVVLLLVLTSHPVLEGLYAVQVGLLVAFLLACSILALQRGELLLSGTLMALTTVKPQVTMLLIIYLLLWSSYSLRKRARFCIGFFVTELLLIAAALLIWPHWIQSWMQLLSAYRSYNPPPLLSMFLASFGLRGPIVFALTAGLLIGATLLAWKNRVAPPDSLEFWLTLSLLLGLSTIAALSGQAVYDHIILLPGILLFASRWRQFCPNRILKAVSGIAAAILFWPWFASVVVILLRFLLTPQHFYSRSIFFLPLCMAVALPFIVLAPLLLGYRAATAPAK